MNWVAATFKATDFKLLTTTTSVFNARAALEAAIAPKFVKYSLFEDQK